MHPLVEYVEHVDVWAATIEDRPGQLAHVMGELRDAGADLHFIIARRTQLPAPTAALVVSAHETLTSGATLNVWNWVKEAPRSAD